MKRIITLFYAIALYSTLSIASEAIPADTNGNGTVDKADATLIYGYILGTAHATVTAAQVDVNGDGKVNTADVVEVYRTILKIKGVTVNDWGNGGTIDAGEAEEN